MKTSLRLTMAAFGMAVFSASAQTSTELALQLYAGLGITGTVGTVYSVENVTDLAQTNNGSPCNVIGRAVADPKAVPRGATLQTLRENGTRGPLVAHSGRERRVSGRVAMREKP